MFRRFIQRVGIDKIAHFAVSAFLTLAIGHFLPWWISSVIVIVLGIVKECLDDIFDRKDLLADACGVLISTAILLI